MTPGLKQTVLVFLPLAVLCLAWGSRTSQHDDSAAETSGTTVTEAVAAICPRNELTRAADGTVTGCRVCPPGTDFENESGITWELRRVTFGHFTAASADNLILGGVGCESHSSNFGGSFLFALESGKPQLLKYHKSLVTEHCHKLRLQDGRDFLVCQHQWGAQGFASSFVWSAVFDGAGKSEFTALFTTEDSVKTCGTDLEGGPPYYPVQHSSIESIRFLDVNGDGLVDMSITATLGKKSLTEGEREACVHAVSSSEPLPVKVSTKEHKIDFLFDGWKFDVAPGSKKAIDLFPEPRFPN